jgi:hypothetical protein
MAEVFYKALRLVMPEIAQAAGLAADAPTFLSPIIQWARIWGVANLVALQNP